MGRFTKGNLSHGQCLPTQQIKRIENRIATLQKRKVKVENFSGRWKYFGRIVSKLHSRITRIRKEFLHQTSGEQSKNHGVIVMEDLRVKNRSKSASGTQEDPGKNVAQKSGLNRAILRQGWDSFRIMLNLINTIVLPCFSNSCAYFERKNQ